MLDAASLDPHRVKLASAANYHRTSPPHTHRQSDIKNLKLLLQYWVEGMGGRVETEAVGAHVSHVVTWQEGALLPRHLAMLSR